MENQREVSQLEAKALAAKNGWNYFETSAKFRANVEEMFVEAAADFCVKKYKNQEPVKKEKKKK